MGAVALTQQDPGVVAQAQAFVNQIALAERALVVDSDAAVETAIAVSQQIKAHEDAFTAEMDKHLEHKKLAERNAKPWRSCRNVLTDTRTAIRQKIAAYRSQQRAAQTAALAEAASAGAGREEIAQAVAVLAPKPAGLSEAEHWHAEIVDETQIPREFWTLDVGKLNALARTQKEAFVVPGARAVKTLKPRIG
jgi:hypothetical protein